MLLTSAVTQASNASQQERFHFKVYLDDQLIGNHEVDISQSGSVKRVSVRADFDVRLMFIPVYSYTHASDELWKDGCLESIRTNTDDNGENYFIDTRQSGELLEIETRQGLQVLDGCIRTFAYWNPELLNSQRLLNTQTGEYQEVTVRYLGVDQLEAYGTSYSARKYRLVCDDMTIDLWYTNDMHWLALETVTVGGARLRYLPDNLIIAELEEK
jgi:hypothetical protein